MSKKSQDIPRKHWTIVNMRKAWATLRSLDNTLPNLPFDDRNRWLYSGSGKHTLMQQQISTTFQHFSTNLHCKSFGTLFETLREPAFQLSLQEGRRKLRYCDQLIEINSCFPTRLIHEVSASCCFLAHRLLTVQKLNRTASNNQTAQCG